MPTRHRRHKAKKQMKKFRKFFRGSSWAWRTRILRKASKRMRQKRRALKLRRLPLEWSVKPYRGLIVDRYHYKKFLRLKKLLSSRVRMGMAITNLIGGQGSSAGGKYQPSRQPFLLQDTAAYTGRRVMEGTDIANRWGLQALKEGASEGTEHSGRSKNLLSRAPKLPVEILKLKAFRGPQFLEAIRAGKRVTGIANTPQLAGYDLEEVGAP